MAKENKCTQECTTQIGYSRIHDVATCEFYDEKKCFKRFDSLLEIILFLNHIFKH